jgi:hypothetical protein
MMPHGSQVDPAERWKIVMYVQQLQKGETGTSVDSEAQNGNAETTAPVESANNTPNN